MPETLVNEKLNNIIWGTVVAIFVGWEVWLGLDQRKRSIRFNDEMMTLYMNHLASIRENGNDLIPTPASDPIFFAAASADEPSIDDGTDDEP